MQGIMFAKLKKYVNTKFGDSTWDNLLKETGIGPKTYLAIRVYPDQEVIT